MSRMILRSSTRKNASASRVDHHRAPEPYANAASSRRSGRTRPSTIANTVNPHRRIAEFPFSPYQVTHVEHSVFAKRGRKKQCPGTRVGHLLCANATDCFLYGGRTYMTNRRRSNELWRFNRLTHTWTMLNKLLLPENIHSVSMCMWDNWLLVYGGTEDRDDCPHDNVYLIDPYQQPQPQARTLETSGDVPNRQVGESIVVRQGQLYVVTGLSLHAGNSCEVYRLDLQTLRWQWLSKGQRNGFPVERFHHHIVVDDDNIYMLGGRTTETVRGTVSLTEMWVFSLARGEWRLVPTLPDESVQPARSPLPRMSFAFVRQVTNGDAEAIIGGGYDEESTCFNDMWTLNLRTMRWRLMVGARLPLHMSAAATDGHGAMYVHSGIEQGDNYIMRTNKLFRVWTKVPTLAQMSWTAMTATSRRLMRLGADRLLAAGVPPQFVSTGE